MDEKWKSDHELGHANCPRVMKLDCIGHVQKKAGIALHEFRKKNAGKLKDGLPVGGRKHRLTDSCIDKLQKYYGNAIRRNVFAGDISSEQAKQHIKNMQNDTMAVLYHSCNIENMERHKFCPSGKDSWCRFKRTGSFGNKDHHPDTIFLELLEPVFRRLSSESPLHHCLPGFSQNNNESINSLVWMRAPKQKYYGPQRVEMAAIGAIVQFNEGASGKHLVMKKAGISWGKHSERGSAQKDTKRIHSAKQKTSQKQRKARKKIRVAKLRAEEERKSVEGTSYGAGKFNDVDPLQFYCSPDGNMPLAQLQAKNSKKNLMFQ